MKKRIALLVYPEFSLQEVTNLMYLFRWDYDTCTDVLSVDRSPVKSEEGICVVPAKTCDEFSAEDYDCLILPGCSDWSEPIRTPAIERFLKQFAGNTDFLIGAICSGPIFLAQAGLLQGKKYTNSLFVEMRTALPFIEEENFTPQPVVEDGNIVTAIGSAFNDFAVHIARKLGYDCPDRILSGYVDTPYPEDFFCHLSDEDTAQFLKENQDLL